MTCPNNAYGQSACQIVQHPDRTGESFCTICQRKFHDEETRGDDLQQLLAAVAAGLIILLVLFNDETQTPIPTNETLPPSSQTSLLFWS